MERRQEARARRAACDVRQRSRSGEDRSRAPEVVSCADSVPAACADRRRSRARERRRSVKSALLVVALLGGVAHADEGITEKSRVEVKPAGKAFKKLQIDNSLGNVRIEGHDGKSIMIETHKHAPDDETL